MLSQQTNFSYTSECKYNYVFATGKGTHHRRIRVLLVSIHLRNL